MNSSDIKVYKSLLRNKLRQILQRLSRPGKNKKSRAITRRFLASHEFRSCRSLAVYLSLASEPETQSLISEALRARKRVFVPRIRQRKEIEFIRIKNLSRDLRKGPFGILEPKSAFKEKASRLEIVVVPGLGFDPRGGRLGRGEGYFDRFLKRAGRVKKIGFAFEEQLLKKIPMTTRDIRMDIIVTDKRVI